MIRRSPWLTLVVWVALSWATSAAVRALAASGGGLALVPQPAFAFLSLAALRAPLLHTLLLAFVLGSETAHAAAAPVGVMETSYVWAAGLVSYGRQRWLGRGARDVALSAAAMSLIVQLSILVFGIAVGHPVVFVSRAALLLLPAALVDGAFALAAFFVLDGLWQKLTLAAHARAVALPRR